MKRHFSVVKDLNSEMPGYKRQRRSKKTRSKSAGMGSVSNRGYSSASGGRRGSLSMSRLRKLALMDNPDVVVRMDAVTSETVDYGMSVMNMATLAEGSNLPLQAFEMTAVPVIKGNTGGSGAGTLVQPQNHYILTATDVNTGIGTHWCPRWNESSNANYKYTTWEKGVGDSTGWDYQNLGSNFKRVWIKWLQAKFQVYQTAKMPLKYTFMFVRFKDRQLVPEQVKNGGAIAENASAQNFWLHQIKPYIAGPMATSDNTLTKAGMQVLMKKTVVVPEQLNDTDYKKRIVVKMHYNVDKMYRLDWANQLTDVVAQAGALPVPIDQSAETGLVRNVAWNDRIKPEARIYCLCLCESLRASATATAGAFTADYHGSFDTVLRVKYSGL